MINTIVTGLVIFHAQFNHPRSSYLRKPFLKAHHRIQVQSPIAYSKMATQTPITRETLTTATKSLCTAFSTSAQLETVLETFTHNPAPQIHEHGLQCLAPFLGRTFTGRDGARDYFTRLNECLGIKEMVFDDEKEWVVDERCMAVNLRGRAKFSAKGSGEEWEEVFAYRISLAEQADGRSKGEVKVQGYEVWADTGAAYLAMRGMLGMVSGDM
ncbi:hypothetical protein BJX99DRAFT_167960 [Aspergillus californicus]